MKKECTAITRISPFVHDCVINIKSLIPKCLLSDYCVDSVVASCLFHNLISVTVEEFRSTNIVTVIKSGRLHWSGRIARMEENSSFSKLTGKPPGKRTLARPMRR